MGEYPRYRVVHGTVSVPASAWTTVVDHIVSCPAVITGFGADVAALLSTTYRFRLQVDGVTVWSEVAGTTQVGYIPLRLTVLEASVAAVQVFHAEATATECVASISLQQK